MAEDAEERDGDGVGEVKERTGHKAQGKSWGASAESSAVEVGVVPELALW